MPPKFISLLWPCQVRSERCPLLAAAGSSLVHAYMQVSNRLHIHQSRGTSTHLLGNQQNIIHERVQQDALNHGLLLMTLLVSEPYTGQSRPVQVAPSSIEEVS